MVALTYVWALTALVLSTLIGAFGGFLAGYLKKKGENLATREDVEKLVEQVKAVTQATKEIEARISNEVWDRQKRWEIKKDAIFEAVKGYARIDDATRKLDTVFQAARQSANPLHVSLSKLKADAADELTQASGEFERTRMLAELVCQAELRYRLGAVGLILRKMAQGIFRDEAEIYMRSVPDLLKEQALLNVAIRKELGIDGPE